MPMWVRSLNQIPPQYESRQSENDPTVDILSFSGQAQKPPFYPEGFDPKVVKVWLPNFEQFEKLRASWIEEWNKTYGHRQ